MDDGDHAWVMAALGSGLLGLGPKGPNPTAQSLGRHVVTIPSLRQTGGQMFPPDKCSPGQLFPRTKLPGHVSTRTLCPRTTGAASLNHLSYT